MLSESRKYKKVLTWSGDFGLDQKSEEFCKAKANELQRKFDLLTSFRERDLSVKQGVMQSKQKKCLQIIYRKQPKFYRGTFSGSSWMMSHLYLKP